MLRYWIFFSFFFVARNVLEIEFWVGWCFGMFRYWTFCNEDVLVKRERERIRVLESCGLFWNVLLRYWIFVTKYEQRIED